MQYRELALSCTLASVFVASIPTAHGQSRQDTVTFLFRNTIINGVGFNYKTDYETRNVTDYSVTEQNCVVHVSGIASETTTNWGDAVSYSGKPISVTIDFNKLFMNTSSQKTLDNGNTVIEVHAGDPDAVYGSNWEWHNDNADNSWDKSGIIPHRSNFTDNHLSLEFFPPDSYRAADAFKYFVATFCPGKHSAF